MTQRGFHSFQDEARLEYGRLLWRNPTVRERLLRHWKDARHPYAARFQETYEPLVREALEAPAAGMPDDELDRRLRAQGFSLRTIMREIPPVFGAFWGEA